MSPEAKRGEIWLVDFEPSVGTEFRKVRPAVVVSNDMANLRTPKVTVLPITGTIRQSAIVVILQPSPTNGLDRESLVRVPDVCTFDKMRLKRRLGCLEANELLEVDAKLRLHLEL